MFTKILKMFGEVFISVEVMYLHIKWYTCFFYIRYLCTNWFSNKILVVISVKYHLVKYRMSQTIIRLLIRVYWMGLTKEPLFLVPTFKRRLTAWSQTMVCWYSFRLRYLSLVRTLGFALVRFRMSHRWYSHIHKFTSL